MEQIPPEIFRKIFSRKFNENFEKSIFFIFRKFSIFSLSKNQKFRFLEIVIEFSRFPPRKFLDEFPPFLKNIVAFEWIVLQGEMIFFDPVFFVLQGIQ